MTEANLQDSAPQIITGLDMPDEETTSMTQILPTSQGSQLATPLVQRTITEPSQELPTRETLDKNYSKPELQKRCRELGISNIWTSKSQLIDMILQHSRSPHNDTLTDITHSPSTPREVTHTVLTPPKVAHSPSTPSEATHTDPPPYEVMHSPPTTRVVAHTDLVQNGVDMLDINRKIESIISKLETKDMEIELLNTEVKTAYHTIELLQQRVTDLEQRCCGNDSHQPSVANSMSSNSCLLLGDTNLRPILLSDLHDNCFVRTIHDANMDLIKSWVTHKLDRIPSECILYSGINDLLEEYSPTTILDNLGSLISALKDKNNSMKIYVCQIVPSSMCQDIIAKIEEYNEQLTKWGETNGI
ncbi:hypothetical protein Pmani_007827 [Petrolisthes manimaculis]|uniref:SAP domain-containing protein n=1 Tax=Petrolisthes manimaculis TaxID=1843537 RepID=A0AAE1Q7H5_9EUCA|nr:hypothetical protein Pmani_007827 [Petrolisthes manimaculis]